MYSLYTQEEMNDAIVGLVNMYGLAGGSALPYMGPGLLARGAALTPRAIGLVGQLTGLSGTTGQVYDTALEIQAADIARREGVKDEGALLKRIEEIKNSKNIDLSQRQDIETKSLIAAAFAAPAGVVQGSYLKSLSMHISKGTSTQEIPRGLLKEISHSLLKGGAISSAQFAYNEAVLFGAGVQNGETSLKNAVVGAPETFVKGAMIAAGSEALRLTKTGAPGQTAQKSELNAQSKHSQETPEQRARFEHYIGLEGFQRGATEGNIGVYPRKSHLPGRPEARDVWYVSGDSKQLLTYGAGWYYGKRSSTGQYAPVKVHVLTENPADLKALQQVLIPALNNDPVLSKIEAWKTMDPMEGFNFGRYPVTGVGQDGKAFTIYARSTQEAAAIHARIDQILTQHNLQAPGLTPRNTTDKPHGNSNRVALCVDFFERTLTTNHQNAAVVDYNVEQALKHYSGVAPTARFTDNQLRKIEYECGLQPRILSYDSNGRLALTVAGEATVREGRIYLSESGEQSQWGGMTGRFAMYSLNRRVNMEPARTELLNSANR